MKVHTIALSTYSWFIGKSLLCMESRCPQYTKRQYIPCILIHMVVGERHGYVMTTKQSDIIHNMITFGIYSFSPRTKSMLLMNTYLEMMATQSSWKKGGGGGTDTPAQNILVFCLLENYVNRQGNGRRVKKAAPPPPPPVFCYS